MGTPDSLAFGKVSFRSTRMSLDPRRENFDLSNPFLLPLLPRIHGFQSISQIIPFICPGFPQVLARSPDAFRLENDYHSPPLSVA